MPNQTPDDPKCPNNWEELLGESPQPAQPEGPPLPTAPEDARSRERVTQAEQLLALARAECTFFLAQEGQPYALVAPLGAGDGCQETLPLRSKGFMNWLCGRFYRAFQRPAKAAAREEVLAILEAQASQGGDRRQVFCRLGGKKHEHGESIFLDLGNPSFQAVEITPAGWSVVASPGVHFRRSRCLGELPEPVAGGSLDELRPFLNLARDDDWRLVLGWLLAALRPQGPYPLLCLQGEQGSAKSTTARLIRSLVDPNAVALRCEPHSARDLAITAHNAWVIAFDNLSHLPTWLSDALCRLSTGGGFATRQLYTDAEEMVFPGQRPVILTGIEEVVTRGDLLDRCLVLQLPAIAEPKRRPEADLFQAWEKAKPRVLGALLDAVVCGLRRLPSIRPEPWPRMADFAVWVTAAAPALGCTALAFLESYRNNAAEANNLTLEASPLVVPLRQLADWQGTCSELLELLAATAPEEVVRSRSWPANAHALSSALRRLAPNLRRGGISVEFTKCRTRGRLVTIRVCDGNACLRDVG